jgi:DNA-binding transcriptional MerR regulator
MHIGEVAARTELSVRSLRHWEEVGLLTPSGRSDGGFRLYTEDDVEKILAVRRMKPLGFTLDEMKEALSHLEVLREGGTTDVDREHAVAHLAAVRDDAVERRLKLARQLEMADEFIAILDRHTA